MTAPHSLFDVGAFCSGGHFGLKPAVRYGLIEGPVWVRSNTATDLIIKVNFGPTVTYAAQCTFLHEGRKAELRCTGKLKWTT
jgi:hypothetical protein